MTIRETIDKTLKWLDANQIKDNLTYIILIPTILGGIWQIWELTNVSVGFIRFFSISQLISDGLLILFLLLFIWLFYRIGSSMGRVQKRGSKEKIIDFQLRAKKHVIRIGFNVGFLIFIMWLFSREKYYLFDFLIIVWVISVIVSSLQTLFIDAGLNISIHKLGKKVYNKFIEPLIKLAVLILLISSVYLITNLIGKFHENYALPLNFENTKNLKEYISRKKGINMNSIEILYFNDQYIFIQTESIGNKILVLELSKLYEEDVLFNHD